MDSNPPPLTPAPSPPDASALQGARPRKASLMDMLTSRAMAFTSATSILPNLDVSFRPRAQSTELPGSKQRRLSSEVEATRGNGASHYDRSDISSAVVSANEKFASLARLVTTLHPHGLEPKARKANHEAIVQHFQLRRVSGEAARASYERADDKEDDGITSDGSDAEKTRRTGTEGSLTQIFAHRRKLQLRNQPRKVRDSIRDLRLHRQLEVEIASHGAVIRSLVKGCRVVWRSLQIAILSSVLPFSPIGTFVRLRGALVFSAMLAQLFFVPLAPVYFPQGSRVTRGLAITFDLVFLLDLLARFNTAFYDDKANSIESSRINIIRRYVRVRGVWWLVVDVIACFPLDVLLSLASQSRGDAIVLVVEIPRAFLRVLQWHSLLPATISGVARMLRSSSKFSFRLLIQRHSIAVQILRIIVVVVLSAHYVACLWRVMVAMSVAQDALDTTDSPWTLYQTDLLTSTQLLVGHLPQAPRPELESVNESVFAIVAMLFGGIVMALVTGLVAMLLFNGSNNSERYQRKLSSVLASMDKLQLPHQLRRRVHQYYDHLWTEHAATESSELTAFTSALSPSLALEVNLFKHMDLVLNVSFWRNCSADFITQIMLSLECCTYLPEDYIMRQGEIGEDLFLINRGVCELRARPSDDDTAALLMPRVRKRLVAGVAFGELALLMNYRRTATARALTFVEMCVLKRSAFQKILARYRDDRREVLREILLSCIEKKSQHVVPFPYEELVASVVATETEPRTAPVTTWEAADMLVDLICAPACTDDSIQFGFQDFDFMAQHRLMPVAGRCASGQPTEMQSPARSSQASPPPPPPSPPRSGPSGDDVDSARLRSMEQWQSETTQRLAGLERGMHAMMTELAHLTQTLASQRLEPGQSSQTSV